MSHEVDQAAVTSGARVTVTLEVVQQNREHLPCPEYISCLNSHTWGGIFRKLNLRVQIICNIKHDTAHPRLTVLHLPQCRIKSWWTHYLQFSCASLPVSCEGYTKESSPESRALWRYYTTTNSGTKSSNIKIFLLYQAKGVPRYFLHGNSFWHVKAVLCYDWWQSDHLWALELHDVFNLKNTGLPGQCLKANRREMCIQSKKKYSEKKIRKLLIGIKLHGSGFTKYTAATWESSVSCSISN